MQHRYDHRTRIWRQRRNPWRASENEPVVASGITGVFEQNPAPKLRRLLHYWVKVKASGHMPSREIVSVFQISGLLPYVWLIDVVRTPQLRFRYGLIKTHVHRAAQQEPAARYIDEIEPKADTKMLCDYFRRVVAEERPLFRRGRPLMPWRSNFRLQQSLYLPLSDKAYQVDAILAISLFRDPQGRWH